MNHNEWMKNSGFCHRLRMARANRGLTHEQVVKMIPGRCSVKILEAYENGNICPSIGRVVELAGVYGCSLDWLCGLEPANWSEGSAT